MFCNKIKPHYVINIVDNSENISIIVYNKDDIDKYRDRYISCDAWSVIYHDNDRYTVIEDIGPFGASRRIKQYSLKFGKAE